MTEKQREAIKILLKQCCDGHLLTDEALTIIESIVDDNKTQFIPWTPWTYPNPGQDIIYNDANSGDTVNDLPNNYTTFG